MNSWRSRFVTVGLAVLVFFLYFTPAVFAQTAAVATPAPAPTQHFTLSGSVVSYMGPSGAAPSSIADGSFNITQRVALGYQQITIPSLATAKLGVGLYGTTLDKLAGKKITGKFVFDATKIGVTFLAGAGKLNESNLNINRIAETGGLYLTYPVSNNLSIKLIGAQWIHGGIVNGPITAGLASGSSNSSAISSGVTVHF